MNRAHRPWSVLAALVLLFIPPVRGASIALVPSGGQAQTTTFDRPAWSIAPEQKGLDFQPGEGTTAPAGTTLYLELTYLDSGYGRIAVTFINSSGAKVKPDKYTNVVLEDTGKWITSYQRLVDIAASSPLVINVEHAQNRSHTPLAIATVAVQDQAFDDAHFHYVLQEDWKRPYAGTTAPGMDNTTLKGKIMVGYQGWFRTPNDPDDRGWVHWGNINDGQFSTDMWPDVSAYPPGSLEKAADVKTLSGKPGELFSPAWPEVVRVHFAWMRQYSIDGAFVQRFLGDMYTRSGRPEWVLSNVRAAANQEGRIWAIEYDVSGAPDDKVLDILKKDWAWLVDNFGIGKDPSYAHENGKPVVFIWGLPVPDRHFTTATADAVVDFFHNDPKYGGNYVIGGIPGNYRKLDPDWQAHIRKYDAALPWMSKDYAGDVIAFKDMGVSYYPHVNPGFSWANLKHLPTGATEQYTARDGGAFYQGLLDKALAAGVDRLFIGMFDEYDEGTAILPMSDDPPPTPTRPGTVVKFFPDLKSQEHAVVINRPQVEMTFSDVAPVDKIPAQNYLSRWEGQIIPSTDGTTTFSIDRVPGDAATLWLDGKQVLKIGANDLTQGTAALPLTAAQPVVYRLDYEHATGAGTMTLKWQLPGAESVSVPANVLVDAWGRFLTNEGHPPDWYLKLTAKAKEQMTAQLGAAGSKN